MRRDDTKFRFGPKSIKGFFQGGGGNGALNLKNCHDFYLPLDFSEIWNNVSYCYFKAIQLGWNQNFGIWPLFILKGGG